MESSSRGLTPPFWLAAALLILALPTTAIASTEVRFLHAVPGVGEATLTADGKRVGSAAFGKVSAQVTVPAGRTRFVLEASGGITLTKTRKLADGASYTVVGLATGDSAELRAYRNQGAVAGQARLRMVHAAPELGDADLALDGQVIAKGAGYTDATRYRTLPPGREELTIQKPGSGERALGMRSLPLTAGTATSAFVVGSAGERVRVVLVDDDSAAPSAAPQTGLGGLAEPDAGGPNWALAVAAALVVGGGVALLRRAQP